MTDNDALVRAAFPVLGSQGAKVDWHFVADHGKQAQRNHYQTVERLAQRGGLSWCELAAVIENREYKNMDTNDAIVAVRSAEAKYLAALRSTPQAEPFQKRVDAWMDACFGETIKADRLERCDRFIEEALELAQTEPSFTKDRAHALVDYVFARPQGEINQEVGGVMVTLAALCNTFGVDFTSAAETELTRVWSKVEQIRAKQAGKPTGAALPVAQAQPLDLPAQDEVGRPKGAGWSTPPEMEADHDERLTKAELKALGLGVSEWAYNHLSKGYAVSLTVREVKRLLATTAIAALDRHRAGDDVRMVTGQLNITFAEFLEYAQENLILEKAGIADMPDFLQPEAVDALREENARLRGALETAAIRLAHLSGQIEASHGISGTLRAEQAMKARHMSDEARAVLTGRQP